jgi:hypothetical protein
MNVYEFVLCILIIMTIWKVIERKRGDPTRSRRSRHHREEASPASDDSESLEKIHSLEERIKVLERIVTDQRYELREKFREIE